jgi:hypothetical protein
MHIDGSIYQLNRVSGDDRQVIGISIAKSTAHSQALCVPCAVRSAGIDGGGSAQHVILLDDSERKIKSN